ncbi:MAG: sulfurtransferase TusA family protein [Thermoanaerobaculia bacterium]
MTAPPVVVDARGLLCPLPLLRLDRAMRAEPSGTSALLLATDPAAEGDVRAWCRARGHDLVAVGRDGDVLTLRVRKA